MTIPLPIAWIDIESSGPEPTLDRIVEFAAVVMEPDMSISRTFVQRFNPGMPIPAEATAVHGITDADVAGCPPFSVRAAAIAKALQGRDIGGYNLRRFDLIILDEELRRCGLKLELAGVRIIDCFGIFQKKEPRKLTDAVRRYCGRDHADAHGALADAQATADVFVGQLRAYEDLAAMDIDGIAEYSRHGDQEYADLAGKLVYDSERQVRYAFGKHRGERVVDEPGFARWMMGKDFAGSTCDVLWGILNPPKADGYSHEDYEIGLKPREV